MMMILSITDGHDGHDQDNDDDTRSTTQEPLQVLHQEGR